MIGWGYMSEADFPVSGLPLSADSSPANRSTGRLDPGTYFFAAFGFALERFTFRTERRVARGLTGALAR